jgi:GT2 family glycosyltransferase
MNYVITGSIVIYKNPIALLKASISSFLNTNLKVKLYLIDNSPTDDFRHLWEDPRIEYIFNNENVGFGKGHNIAIRRGIIEAPYHLILNPDIYYNTGTLESLILYLEVNMNVGLLVPKVLYPNGEVQYLTKLLPSPFDFIVRRVIPFKSIKEEMTKKFELRATNYDRVIEAPYLSGCFMIFRSSVLKAIEGFDENIFMHMEDLDITRRVLNTGYKTIFFPDVSVYHDHERKIMTNIKTLSIYVKSAIYYFNKWGWFFDKNRKKINEETYQRFTLSKGE